MFHHFYSKFIKCKFFNKIILVYCLVTISAILAVAAMALVHISIQQQSELTDFNEQALESISSHLNDEVNAAKSIMQKIYIDEIIYPEILYLMENGYNKHLEYKLDRLIMSPENKYHGFEDYFKTALLNNNDITGFSIYSYGQDNAFVYSRFGKVMWPKDEYILKYIDSDTYILDFKIIPSHYINYSYGINSDIRVFSLAFQIKDNFSSKNLGYIIIDIQTDSFYREFSRKYTGEILVSKSDGEVIFDSYNKCYGRINKRNMDFMKSSKSSPESKDYIINVRDFMSSDVLIGAFLQKPGLGDAAIQGKLILIFAVVLITIMLFLTFMVIHAFSKRITTIMTAINEVGNGNLKRRIPIYNKEDEFNIISKSFNYMCDKIDEYIKKVYISEIKQKNAQLKALQTQINPHFLYNTLEAIRMRALVKGAKDVGDMIYILSSLFKKSIKEKMIISIGEEVKYSKMYLELFNIRFKDKIKAQFDIPEDILNFAILKHSIQPFIENYILHGLDMEKDENILIIKCVMKDTDIYVQIIDNGTGISDQKLDNIRGLLNNECTREQRGIGIANVNERIKLFFGNKYGIEISSTLGNGTFVLLKIPAKLKEELEYHVQGFDS